MQAPRRGCDENKEEELEKTTATQIFLMEGGLYNAVSKDWLG